MTEYYFLIKVPLLNTNFYIEVGVERNLPFHPNTTDIIEILGYICKITEIFYDVDDLKYITIRLEVTDCYPMPKSGNSEEDNHNIMQREWLDLKETADANQERIILNDYYMDPRKNYIAREV